ncbi:hypothetical protein ACQP00_39535 [Dactylosporangium sp. CS-047395]|uniref:hypothetical protein n=1 Tax=Dactylosporangium sp. CS-047395 TaxID=3239936 RepID=UPI003D92E6DB
MSIRLPSLPGRFWALPLLVVFAAPVWLFTPWRVALVVSLVVAGGVLAGLVVRGLVQRRWRPRMRRRAYLVPADLPPPPELLIGRDDELDRLTRLLTAAHRDRSGPAVAVVTGREGVGKTALAVTAGHLVAPRYRDGQILVRFDTQRPDGDDLAREYLTRALLGPGDADPGAEGFDRWYRRRTLTRRILVVLDNVPAGLDLARFTPAGRRCAIVVTSRRTVEGLAPDLVEHLEPLDGTASRRLVAALLGAGAVVLDERLDERIMRAARGYPAALQMAAAVARSRRSEDLDVPPRAEPPGEAGALPFAEVLDLACALLTEQERRCLTVLSLSEHRRVAPWTLVALARGAFPHDATFAAFDEFQAGCVLDRLARVRFVELRADERSGVAVFRIPYFVRQYAAMLAEAELGADGIERARDAYVAADRSRLERQPEMRLRRDVYHLFDDGRLSEALGNAREVVHLAQERSQAVKDRRSVEADAARRDEALAEVGLAEVFAELGWIDDALSAATSAARSVEAATRSRALRVQGRIRWRLRQSAAAVERLRLAREQAERNERDPAELIRVLRELTVASALSDQPETALEYGEQALRLCGTAPDEQPRRLPGVLWAYGLALTANRRHDRAAEVLSRGDTLSGQPELAQGLWRPWIRHQRAYLALQSRDFEAARGFAVSALNGFTTLKHRYGSGHSRLLIGRAYLHEERDLERAVSALEEALQTFQRCGDRWAEAEASYWLGVAYKNRGDLPKATLLLRLAVEMFETLKDGAGAKDAREALDREWSLSSLLGRRGTRHSEQPRISS